ncbi:MAG: twin-arginine translocase TatA/TatE family subunit [Actinomycetota bacterium]
MLVVFVTVFNITGGEVLIIAVLALIVLGPDKLPDFIRKAGRIYGEVKKISTGFKTEFKDVIEEPVREMQDTVNLAKGWFDEGKTAVETMDDSRWGAGGEGNSDQQAVQGALSAGNGSVDAFGAVPDESLVIDDVDRDVDDDGDDDVDEDDDDPNLYHADGSIVDGTSLNRFFEESASANSGSVTADPFGAVAPKPAAEGSTE